jgi:hypothetical protein
MRAAVQTAPLTISFLLTPSSTTRALRKAFEASVQK